MATPKNGSVRKPAAPNTLAMCRMFAMLLSSDGATVNEIVEETGLARGTVQRWTATMKAEGIAYRAAWTRKETCNTAVPVWRMELDRRDAARPKPIPEQDRKTRYIVRRRAINDQAKLLGLLREERA